MSFLNEVRIHAIISLSASSARMKIALQEGLHFEPCCAALEKAPGSFSPLTQSRKSNYCWLTFSEVLELCEQPEIFLRVAYGYHFQIPVSIPVNTTAENIIGNFLLIGIVI